MQIAVLSGKGGTGKTLLSVNLAAAACEATYIDCDVEEPNGHLFFKPEIDEEWEITVKIPFVNKELCDGCQKCVDFCAFNALAYAGGGLIIFDEICHSCGGCIMLCPRGALMEKEKAIGKIIRGRAGRVRFRSGILNIGEASGVPIIKELLAEEKSVPAALTFVDSPPGTACIAMESISEADYCVLVAEPTVFGAHNLEMVQEMVKVLKKPFGVVLNKCVDGDNPAEEFCLKAGIKVLYKIPFDPALGRLTSDAGIAALKNEKYGLLFSSLLAVILKEARCETTAHS